MDTIVYVDAFNLYYGCLKGTPYRWLDLAKLCGFALPRNDIFAIKYFTAHVNTRSPSASTHAKQSAYLDALSTIPTLSITLGHHLVHKVRMPLANPIPGLPKFVEVVKTDEKGTDVNLATQMVHDAHLGRMKCAVVISNDSDFAYAIRICRRELGLSVGVLNPQKRAARTLINETSFFNKSRQGVLAASQFPDFVQVGKRTVHRPSDWYSPTQAPS